MALQISKSQSKAVAPSSGAASVSPCPKNQTIEAFSKATAKPGASAMQIAARKALVENFYMNTPGLLPPNVPDTKRNRRIMFQSQAKGIDFTKPVEIIQMPPPPQLVQHVRKGSGKVGQFFDPVGDQSGTSLGLNTDPKVREKRTFDISNSKDQKITALKSTAAPIVDDWTDKGRPVECRGGGEQIFVPHNAISKISPEGESSR